MHDKPMAEYEGVFGQIIHTDRACPKCGRKMLACYKWESSDGAYTDYKYICQHKDCYHSFWVEGADS